MKALKKLISLARKIPGHIGIKNNEVSDLLFKKVATAKPIGPEPFLLEMWIPSSREELQKEERNK